MEPETIFDVPIELLGRIEPGYELGWLVELRDGTKLELAYNEVVETVGDTGYSVEALMVIEPDEGMV